MSTPRRKRRVEAHAETAVYRPLYARALRLRHLRLGGMLCFLYFEGSIALATLLALAELVTWWAVLVLPVSIAVMVKMNDVVAGYGARAAAAARGKAAVRSAAREAARRMATPAVSRARAARAAASRSVASGRPTGRASVPASLVLSRQPVDGERRPAEARHRRSAAHRYE